MRPEDETGRKRATPGVCEQREAIKISVECKNRDDSNGWNNCGCRGSRDNTVRIDKGPWVERVQWYETTSKQPLRPVVICTDGERSPGRPCRLRIRL